MKKMKEGGNNNPLPPKIPCIKLSKVNIHPITTEADGHVQLSH